MPTLGARARATPSASPGGSNRDRRASPASARAEFDADANERTTTTMVDRVFVVSDVHVDATANAAWVRGLRDRRGCAGAGRDVLCVGGDVSDDVEEVRAALEEFQSRGFAEVFYTFGNHECWMNAEDERVGRETSVSKIRDLLAICEEMGVRTRPGKVGDGLWIAPLHSYHHRGFDTEPEVDAPEVPPVERVMNDFRFARWPDNLSDITDDVARWCDGLNDHGWDEFVASIEPGDKVLSFSHFLPRLELIPEKRMLFYPRLAQASGSEFLRKRVDTLKARVNEGNLTHAFGHTHFGWNQTLDGVRYVQAALATPSEWSKRPRSLEIGEFTNLSEEPLCVYEHGEFVEGQRAMWSDYYAANERAPEDVELLPHARQFIRQRWGPGRRATVSSDASSLHPGATGVVERR